VSPRYAAGGGLLAFNALLSGPGINSSNDEGLWMATGGVVSLLARDGQQAPAAGAPIFFTGGFQLPPVSRDGHLAFSASYTGSASVGTGIWYGLPGQLSLVTHTGMTATGLPAGVTISSLDPPNINTRGTIAFNSLLAGPGVVQANSQALF